MIARLAAFAFVLASIPAPPANAEADVLMGALCNGGTISIPLGDGEDPAPAGPCELQACHAGACRLKVKKSI